MATRSVQLHHSSQTNPLTPLLQYESEWPVGPNGAVPKKSFDTPQAPVHVVTGAGGAPAFGAEAPSSPPASAAAPPPFTRLNVYRWSFSVIEATNASHLSFAQVDNNGSAVFDSFTIVQPKHGKFGLQ